MPVLQEWNGSAWVDVGPSPATATTVLSSSATVAFGGTYLCTATLTATLPTGSTAGQITIKNISTGVVTVAGTVDGSTSTTLAQYQSLTVVSDGTNFFNI